MDGAPDVLQAQALQAGLRRDGGCARAHAFLAKRVVTEVEHRQLAPRQSAAQRAQRVECLVLGPAGDHVGDVGVAQTSSHVRNRLGGHGSCVAAKALCAEADLADHGAWRQHVLEHLLSQVGCQEGTVVRVEQVHGLRLAAASAALRRGLATILHGLKHQLCKLPGVSLGGLDGRPRARGDVGRHLRRRVRLALDARCRGCCVGVSDLTAACVRQACQRRRDAAHNVGALAR
mmetsp:Transcript_20605/g.61487  ORF Transcript_20605/g.61487 Transcript_20605/m.61487 type:complete len:232 (-) Transcript_20605:64-759(-)